MTVRRVKRQSQNSEQQKRIFRSAGFQTRQFLIYSIRSIREKIGVCLTVDLQTFYPSKADGQGMLAIQIQWNELNCVVSLSMHLSWE